jgi:hypothetical protein
MTVLTDRHADRSDVLASSRRIDEQGSRTTSFPIADTFEGEILDPQSLHKYAYVHGDPIQGIDPSGRIESVVSLSFTMGFRGGLLGLGLGYAYGVYESGGNFASWTAIKYAIIGALAGFAIGATVGAYLGYAAGAARGLSSGGALHNFIKIAEKLYTVPKAIRAGTLAAGKGTIFASFVLGAAAGAWAAVFEDIEELNEWYPGALAVETAASLAYHEFLRDVLIKSGVGTIAVGLSGLADITISFTIGFNTGYFLSKGVQISTEHIAYTLLR